MPGLVPLELNMSEIYEAERRVQDIASLTPLKAPELLSVFNKVFLTLNTYLREVDLAHHQAKRRAAKLKAIIILDKVPNKLGPKSNEDQRTAMMDLDEEYQDALSEADNIRCISELLRGKQKGMEMAFYSVKAVLAEASSFGYHRNTNLSHGSFPENLEAGMDLPTVLR